MQQTKLLIDDLRAVFVLFDVVYVCLISHLPHLSTSLIASDVQSLYLKTQQFWPSLFPSTPVLVVVCLGQFVLCKLEVSYACSACPWATSLRIIYAPHSFHPSGRWGFPAILVKLVSWLHECFKMIDILIEKQNLVLISLDWHPHIAASLLAKTTYRGTIIKLGMAGWMTKFGLRLIFN